MILIVCPCVSLCVRVCPGYVDPLQALSDATAQLDAVVSLAAAAVSAPVPYVRPRLLAPEEPRRLELRQARHPCMETDADAAFIPNDISFTRGEKSFYIITGEQGPIHGLLGSLVFCCIVTSHHNNCCHFGSMGA